MFPSMGSLDMSQNQNGISSCFSSQNKNNIFLIELPPPSPRNCWPSPGARPRSRSSCFPPSRRSRTRRLWSRPPTRSEDYSARKLIKKTSHKSYYPNTFVQDGIIAYCDNRLHCDIFARPSTVTISGSPVPIPVGGLQI